LLDRPFSYRAQTCPSAILGPYAARTARLASLTLLALALCPLAAPALAARLVSVRPTSIAYNQGVTYDPRLGSFFFSGVTSATNSGLFRTDSRLRQTAARYAAIPASRQHFNHIGDLSFDPVRRRVLAPLECYYPRRGGNTCRRGAIGVADPRTLALRYRVLLDASQIAKASWAEISPDGSWIWTSAGRHLLAYRASDVSPATAARQRTGGAPGLVGRDLGAVLPTAGITGAAELPSVAGYRLLLSLNRGTFFQVVSYLVTTAPDGSPSISSSPRPEISVRRSTRNHEAEGLVVTPRRAGAYPLGAPLHWQMLPSFSLYMRILSYA
jgi:hypothetical protein